MFGTKKNFGLPDSLIAAVTEAMKVKKEDDANLAKVNDIADNLKGMTTSKAGKLPNTDAGGPDMFKSNAPSIVKKEELKGNQHKIDKNKKGKVDAHDFKMLRSKKKPQGADYAEQRRKDRLASNGRMDEADSYSIKNTKTDNTYHISKYPITSNHSIYKKIKAKDPQAQIHKNGQPMKEEVVSEADDAIAKQIATKKDAMQKQIRQKIAQKQMSVLQQKAQKKIQTIKAGTEKCSCDSTNESKMKCEVHGGNMNGIKGGKEAIVVNPPLREASKTKY
jgi:hypothetical protein